MLFEVIMVLYVLLPTEEEFKIVNSIKIYPCHDKIMLKCNEGINEDSGIFSVRAQTTTTRM